MGCVGATWTVTQVSSVQWRKKNWKCSKPRAGVSLLIVLVSDAILQVAVTLAAMMVGLKTPQNFAAVCLMLHVLQEGHRALSVAPSRFVGQWHGKGVEARKLTEVYGVCMRFGMQAQQHCELSETTLHPKITGKIVCKSWAILL